MIQRAGTLLSGSWSASYGVNRREAYLGLGKLEPDDEDGLEDKVKGQIVEDETEGEAFQKVEKAKLGVDTSARSMGTPCPQPIRRVRTVTQ